MSYTVETLPSERIGEDDLLSLVYVSTATVPFSDADLATLLSTSRVNNETRGLTGVLLYRGGHFMQALEGPARAVRLALSRIAADPRHTGVWTVSEEPIRERRFGSWAMGHRALSAEDAASAPSWFGSPERTERLDRSRAGELLAWFRER